ncbi:ATP-dependent helicase [Methanosarcina mazei]|uniref:ATP-dependent helicase n=3 Tax=Methanosarcina mazei TaxID=2209 RepID=A0A0F8N332_METMZ|nr:putative ATP-dependent helicase [Methanosarcina mazei WWM610]KKG04304.1 ATP-dependent helicase [Methanosarcina mazei]KKH39933.1 ATP-dependent helicase [Methanosarcina mazei]KKH44330.1 ATP-dependent helicase [Methanosarcina mazei]KKH45007.1 ATP-dependent helicase [Methanosarcina mazei]
MEKLYIKSTLLKKEKMEESEILEYFPKKYLPRDAQIAVLTGIEKAIKQGKKYILIQAPTGVGKSAIAYTVMKYFGEGYVCTATKSLQDQYLADFPDLLTVKGRSNYICKTRNDGKTCDLGACVVQDLMCSRKPGTKETKYPAYYSERDHCTKYWTGPTGDPERCDYWIDKAKALNNFGVVHNYQYLLHEANFAGDFVGRKILISDEGHNIEAMIIAFIKVPIVYENLTLINKFLGDFKIQFVTPDSDMENEQKLRLHAGWLMKLREAAILAEENIKKLAKEELDIKINLEHSVATVKDSEISDIQEKIRGKIQRLDDLNMDLQKVNSLRMSKIEPFLKDISKNLDNWVVKEEFFEKGSGLKSIEFQPVRISQYAYDRYLRLGNINVIMSATILNPAVVANDLGINPAEIEYLEIPPVYPKEKNKVFNLGIANFKYYNDETPEEEEEFYKEVVERIDMILELFPEDKGIIHCATYRISDFIEKYSAYKDRLIFHNSANREEKLQEHLSRIGEGTVLVSPSMTEGVDLKDDLSRFQVMIKVPYPDLADTRISRRKELEEKMKLRPLSYVYKTAIVIIQAIGRSVRTETDYAVTFTLDTRFTSFAIQQPELMRLFTRHVRNNKEISKLEGMKGKDAFFLNKLTRKIFRKAEHRQKSRHIKRMFN